MAELVTVKVMVYNLLVTSTFWPSVILSLKAELYLFYADWCPYSKKLREGTGGKGPWEKLKETYPDGEKPEGSDYILKYVEINGDTDAKSIGHFEKMYLSGAEGIKKKIDGYPSIYLKIEDKLLNTKQNHHTHHWLILLNKL